MFRFLLLIFFISINATASSALTADSTAVVHTVLAKYDKSSLHIRNFNPKQLESYAKQREFTYLDTPPLNISLWTRFWKWIWGLVESVLTDSYSGNLIKYLIIGVLVALVAYFLVKLAGLDLRVISGKSKPVEIPYSESLENIHEINFSEEIAKAINISNYRLAVRLFYLSSLKKLNDKKLVDWQPEKTNQTYINELTDPEKRQSFELLTAQFEYIWYGEFFIGEEDFNLVKDGFDTFNKDIS